MDVFQEHLSCQTICQFVKQARASISLFGHDKGQSLFTSCQRLGEIILLNRNNPDRNRPIMTYFDGFNP